jgi:hypothetical protein
MSTREIVIHTVIVIVAALGIFISLAGMTFLWVSRKMKKMKINSLT